MIAAIHSPTFIIDINPWILLGILNKQPFDNYRLSRHVHGWHKSSSRHAISPPEVHPSFYYFIPSPLEPTFKIEWR